jgi:hypothetical protein
MKYIKKFENIKISQDEIQNHLYEIQEIFQEYIDNYDIEQINLASLPNQNGLYYNVEYVGTDYKKIYFNYSIFIIDDNVLNVGSDKYSVFNRFLEFQKNNLIIISTLKSFGYECKTRVPFTKGGKTIDNEAAEYQFKINYEL